MAQQTASSNGVTAALWGVVEEIDDDDEDILEVTIDVVNDSSRDMWDINGCLLYTSPSPRDRQKSRMPSSA